MLVERIFVCLIFANALLVSILPVSLQAKGQYKRIEEVNIRFYPPQHFSCPVIF